MYTYMISCFAYAFFLYWLYLRYLLQSINALSSSRFLVEKKNPVVIMAQNCIEIQRGTRVKGQPCKRDRDRGKILEKRSECRGEGDRQ